MRSESVGKVMAMTYKKHAMRAKAVKTAVHWLVHAPEAAITALIRHIRRVIAACWCESSALQQVITCNFSAAIFQQVQQ
jgi:hypothetical protein